MGITVNYTLELAGDTPPAQVEALVRKLHRLAKQLAQRRGLEAVHPVGRPGDAPHFSTRWLSRRRGNCTTFSHQVPANDGWLFPVVFGDGCEPAFLGLCRYPATVPGAAGRSIRTRLGDRWSFQGFCKTQYASLHGAEHLVKCHVALIDLLWQWESAGVAVTIHDEGGYWPGRDAATLLRRVGFLNRMTAALAGAMKDASDTEGTEIAGVHSPIFSHPQFERLEAEGVAESGPALAEAQAAIRKVQPRRPRASY